MKILHVITELQKAAGTTVFCVRIAEELVKLGHQVVVAVKRKPSANDWLPKGCGVFVWHPGEPLSFRPDIVHIHGVWPLWLHRAHVWARKRSIKVVFSPHGMLAPWSMAHKRWKKLLPWTLYQRADIANASVLHTTSVQETAWLRALGFKNEIVEIPLGTDVSEEVATFDSPTRFLLFVGRIYPVKGLDLLVKAWAQVKALAREKGWGLLLVGPNQAGHMEELEQLASEKGLTVLLGIEDDMSRVKQEESHADILFTGALYGKEKDAAYQMSRALILPSYTENFGGVVIDAMSFGLPVLTSEATPWNFLESEGCGVSFPLDVEALAGRLKELFNSDDRTLWEQGQKGRSLVGQRYAWSTLAQRLARVYLV